MNIEVSVLVKLQYFVCIYMPDNFGGHGDPLEFHAFCCTHFLHTRSYVCAHFVSDRDAHGIHVRTINCLHAMVAGGLCPRSRRCQQWPEGGMYCSRRVRSVYLISKLLVGIAEFGRLISFCVYGECGGFEGF